MFVNNYDSVADIYDIYNQSDYDIDFYLKRYRDFKGNAIELMAGTGRLAIPLLKSGMRLDCLDISPHLLAKLNEKVKKYNVDTQIFNADIRELTLAKAYDLIIIGFNSLSEIIDEHDLESIFRALYNHLSIHGEFVFSLYNPDYRRKYINNALCLVNEYQHMEQKVLFFISSKEDKNSIVDVTQLYEFYNAAGCLERKKLLKLKFRLIGKEEIEKLIIKAGFLIKDVFGNYNEDLFDAAASPFMIYIVTKD